jgi:hypothetical protein
MVSAFGWFTIGSAVVLSLRASASQTHHTRYRLTTNPTNFFELGLPVQYIYAHLPKPMLHEVHYTRHVGIPNGRVDLPSPFGISTRRTGGGK